MKPCPFCSAELEPFGPDQFNHPRNDCWLSSVSIKAHEFDAWNRRAESAAGAARQGGGTSEKGGLLVDSKTAESRMGSGFEGGHLGSAPAAGTEKDADLSPELQEIHHFLLGEGQLEGVNFGEWHSLAIGEWWWRKRLRAAIGAYTKARKEPA